MTAVAREGLDGILVNPLWSSHLCPVYNLPFSRDLYHTETLFGPELSFVLPHGKHTLIAKIRDLETGLIVHTCHLKYNVIVLRCQFPHVKTRHLRMFCTAGSTWGSKCAFECKIKGTHLSHNKPIICNENLEWAGHEPQCVHNISMYSTCEFSQLVMTLLCLYVMQRMKCRTAKMKSIARNQLNQLTSDIHAADQKIKLL